MTAPIRFLSGRQQQQKIGVEGSTENQKVLEVVGRVGIGSTIFEPSVSLDVRGSANIRDTLTINGLDVGAGSSLSNTTISQLQVTGVSTFVGVTTSTSTLFVNQLSVAGVATFAGITTVTGTTLFARQLNVSGVSTFNGITTHTAPIFGTSVSLSGVGTIPTLFSTSASFSQLQVTGISTFTNGPVLVGSATSTGTASQRLQVTGGAYVSGSVGLGITAPREELDVVGDIGVQASGASNRFVIQHNNALSSLDFIFV